MNRDKEQSKILKSKSKEIREPEDACFETKKPKSQSSIETNSSQGQRKTAT